LVILITANLGLY